MTLFFINTLESVLTDIQLSSLKKSKIRGALKYVFSGIRALISVRAFIVLSNLNAEKENHMKTLMINYCQWKNGRVESYLYITIPLIIDGDIRANYFQV